ncbi:hypothetical protein BGX23_005486 [Mortierella sp. AD031]|nr:hypothetical protein BGX23_005486 [Mortierella sp. AD031]KAG0214162.1 hypothetical protein BGX33_002409 [Mortierella sp. NVP41]
MRRVHPQRAKPPVQPNKPLPGGGTSSNVSYETKPWTTQADLHKQYNNSSIINQAPKHSNPTTNNPTSISTTAKKPFALNTSSLHRPPPLHSQEQEPDATNLKNSGCRPVIKINKRSRPDSGSAGGGGGSGGGDKSTDHKTPGGRIVVLEDDDDDDEFDFPDIDSLFSDGPRKLCRVESNSGHMTNPSSSNNNSSRHHNHHQEKTTTHTKDKTPSGSSRGQPLSDMRMDTNSMDKRQLHQQPKDSDVDPRMNSDRHDHSSAAFGFGIVTPLQNANHNNKCTAPHRNKKQQLPAPAMSTRSVVSETQQTLNEIEMFFNLDEFTPQSPSPPRHQSPLGDRAMSIMTELRSPTPFVGAFDRFPSHNDGGVEADADAAGPVSNRQEAEPMEQDTKSKGRGGEQDARTSSAAALGDRAQAEGHVEPVDVPQGNRDALNDGDEAVEVDVQVTVTNEDAEGAQETLQFAVPETTDAYQNRLNGKPEAALFNELTSDMRFSMEYMMETIRVVDQLGATIGKTLLDRQEFLRDREERVNHQSRLLQEEATSLHSKTELNMLQEVLKKL